MSLEIIGKRKKYQGEFMELWATNFIKNTGKAGEWEWIAKKDGVVVLPITKDNKIVLIENFRIPVGGYNVELPAGLLDKEGEPPQEAARRELLEETGYAAGEMVELSEYYALPGISNMKMRLYVATECVKAQEPNCEPSEDIKVLLVDSDQLFQFYEKYYPQSLFSLGIFAGYYIALQKGLINAKK